MSASGEHQPELLADKLAAIYFVTPPSFPNGTMNEGASWYREYVLVNEAMIESFELNTPQLATAIELQANWLTEIAAPTSEFQQALPTSGEYASAMVSVDYNKFHFIPLAAGWEPWPNTRYPAALVAFGSTTCFLSKEYYPSPANLTALSAALRAIAKGVPFSHVVNPTTLPPAPAVMTARPTPAKPVPPLRRRDGTY